MKMLIRADASPEIGVGHVMRCLALTQAWHEDGGSAHFAFTSMTPALEKRLRAENVTTVNLDAISGSVADATQTVALAKQVRTDWVVVDGYHFDASYQRAIKEAGLRLMFVDDYGHASRYCADLVLNQNVYANKSLYPSREPGTRLLLGTRYALLRREFWPWKDWVRNTPPVAHKVLVTLGGADLKNVTLKVVQALELLSIDELDAIVVLGSGNLHVEGLRKTIQNSQIRLVHDVDTMPELIAWADVAVSAGGTTSWELAFMGLPSVLIALADNQRLVAQGLHEAGAAQYLGSYEALSTETIAMTLAALLMDAPQRTQMCLWGRLLVDGKGSERVLMALQDTPVRLRSIVKDDRKLLWEWVNDPDARAASFSSAPIPWDEHMEWFRSKLQSPESTIYIALNDDGVPIGQVRYDVDGGEATISLSVDRRFRGRGYGRLIIQLGCDEIFSGRIGVDVVHAYVKPDNESSIHAFMNAGFDIAGSSTVRGHQAVHLTLRKGKTLAGSDPRE